MTRTLAAFILLLAMVAPATANPAKKTDASPALAQDKTATAPMVSQGNEFGDLNPETFAAVSTKIQEALGVRAGRVLHREELPTGPWATGEIGDYLIENQLVRVIVRAPGRDPNPEASGDLPRGGAIVDVVLRNQNWDSFGGLNYVLKIDKDFREIKCTRIQVTPPSETRKTPLLVLYGEADGLPEIKTITTLGMEPGKPGLIVKTVLVNSGKTALNLTLVERVNWGTLPVFVGGYGIPPTSKVMKFGAPWVSGVLDDFCLSEATGGTQSIQIVRLHDNIGLHSLIDQNLEAGASAEAARTFVVTNGDMGPITELALNAKSVAHGFVEGTVMQLSDKKPIAGAEIQIRMLNTAEKVSNLAWPAYAKTLSDAKGHYRMAVPFGEYSVQCKTVGRPLLPVSLAATLVTKNKSYNCDLQQTDLSTFDFQVTDADTQKPIPAKVTFVPAVSKTRPVGLGAPWQAQGTRFTYYLKPGENKVPVLTGVISNTFDCTFSHGPEYEAITKQLTFIEDKPQSIKIALKHLVATPGMVSVDLNLPTNLSPTSRVSPEDLVLAAAGEGVEWIFSGDLNQATDLTGAIKKQGLEKFIRASSGINLSFQYPKLFGEFYVFPVPRNTKAETIKALAGPRTRPDEFFKAVRKAFPNAIIAVMNPMFVNTSYLTYYNMDVATGKSPFKNDFSLGFDAIETHEGKATQANDQNWQTMLNLYGNSIPKFPIASSRCSNLLYEEPGYPRMYLVSSSDDPASMTDEEAAKTIRNGRYFITNGPIIQQAAITDPKVCSIVRQFQQNQQTMEYTMDQGKIGISGLSISKQAVNEFWPSSPTNLPVGEFVQLLKITAAPWVRTTAIVSFDAGNAERQLISRPETTAVRYPVDASSRTPYLWTLHVKNPETNKEVFRDTYVRTEVEGSSLAPVVTRAPHGTYEAFAMTPPIVMKSTPGKEASKTEVKPTKSKKRAK